jgi:hypothetical protein
LIDTACFLRASVGMLLEAVLLPHKADRIRIRYSMSMTQDLIRMVKRIVLHIMRTPMSMYLKSVEAKIPKPILLQKHIKHLRVVPDRIALLRLLPANAVVAELGVDEGGFTSQILEICTPEKLHLIDFWGSRRYHQGKREGVFRRFAKEIESSTVEIHLGLSIDVVHEFADHYFDWIYIDTDHTYNTTKQELEMYRTKVKEGGIITGHDYIIGNWTGMRRYGVIEAVHEFCIKYNWEMLFLTIENHRPPSFAIRKILS